MSTPYTPPDWLLTVIRSVNGITANYATPEDGGLVLAFMALAFPNRPEVTVAQVRVLLMRKNFSEARTLLADSERLHPRNSVVKVMTALCLYMQGDPLWEAYADEAVALPSAPITKALLTWLSKVSGKNYDGAAPAVASAPSTDYYAYQGLAC